MRKTGNHCGRYLSCDRGVAAVEFALLLPVLLTMLLGSYELSRYIVLNERIDHVAYTTADVLAQTSEPTAAMVTDVMSAATKIMDPFEFGARGDVIASYVCGDAAGRSVIKEQYEGGGTLDRNSALGNKNAVADLPGEITLAEGDCVVVAEVYYIYVPAITESFFGSRENYRTAVFKLRYGTLKTLN